MDKTYTLSDLVDGLNEAFNLLECAGPNSICISSEEYFQRLHALQDKFYPEEEE